MSLHDGVLRSVLVARQRVAVGKSRHTVISQERTFVVTLGLIVQISGIKPNISVRPSQLSSLRFVICREKIKVECVPHITL